MNRQSTKVLCALTVLHPLVDLLTASLCMWAAAAPWQFFLYNFVAFALQLPLGWLLDARPRPLRSMLSVSAAFMAAGLAVFGIFREPAVAIALMCLGNAMFHVAGGKHVIETCSGRAAQVGLFISTGALGLFAGMRFGKEFPESLTLGALALFVLVVAAGWRTMARGTGDGTSRAPTGAVRPLEIVAVLALCAVVVWRSHGVLSATQAFNESGAGLMLVFSLVYFSWLGQALGGFLSDWIGRRWVVAVSLLGGAALAWFCPASCVWGVLALMFTAQLATAPVLTLLFDSCHVRGGLACGLNCFALFASTLFFNCPDRVLFYFAGDWLAVALEFAATAWIRLPYWFFALVAVNLTTHPALVYAVHRIGYSMPVVAVGEVLVVLVEGALLACFYRRRLAWWKAFLVAAWMNVVSYFTGVALFGW